jgi:hypothetical protein
VVLGLIALEGLFWLSERSHCYSFNEDKTWTLLIALATAAMAMLWMLAWLALALVFRWRFQFTMRSLLVLVVALAIPCSWLAVHMKEARAQRQTIAAIAAAGGSVYYSYEWGGWGEFITDDKVKTHFRLDDRPGMVPSFLLKFLSEDIFVFDVAAVELDECNDTAFAALRTLRNLKSLSAAQFKVNGRGAPNVVESNLTDRGMAELDNFPGLESLWINNSPRVTASGFRHLSRLTKLTTLDLIDCTRFCDADLANLRDATSLRKLFLGQTLVAGAGLAQLSRLQQLSSVTVCGPAAAVTDDGLAGVGSLSGLEDLDLSTTRVTDKGLIHLRKLTKLTCLRLNQTRVNGSGFKHLSNLKSLRELHLMECRVTSEGLAGLRGLTGLTELDLAFNQITDSGLANLRPLVDLELLCLECNDALSDAAVEDLKRRLPQTSILFFRREEKGIVPRSLEEEANAQ